MTRVTQEWVEEYIENVKSWSGNHKADNDSPETPDEGPESLLAGKIMKYCKDHGFPCQCFRQSKKAKGFLVPGLTD